jgi:RHS repeat-associated protein
VTDAANGQTNYQYDAFDLPKQATDPAGNVVTQVNVTGLGYSEWFIYDGLGRPQTRTISSDASYVFDYAYNTLGLLDTLTYPTSTASTRFKAKYGYDGNGNLSTRNGATLTWSSFNLPTSINDPSDYAAQFDYAPDRSRWRQVSSYAGATETTIYAGGVLEKFTNAAGTHWKHLIPTPSGEVQVIRRSSGAHEVYYLATDHLGSTDVVLNAAGAVLSRPSFAAYGARRNAATWSGAPTPVEWQSIADTTRRGYTGHEHLDNVRLIHMNGRVFDPNIGRFLSADPYVDGIDTTQGWNRFAYVQGRVLSATDPSGFFQGLPMMTLRYDEGCSCFMMEWQPALEEVIVPGMRISDRGPTLGPILIRTGPMTPIRPVGDGGGNRAANDNKKQPQRDLTNCVNPAVRVAQTVVGSIQVAAGTVQTVAGVIQVGAGLFGTPAGGVSLLAVPGGLASATLGSASIIDGAMLIRTAWDGSGDSYVTFERIGGSLRGDIGAQTGGYLGFLGQVVASAKSSPTTSAAAAANAAMMVASSILPSAGSVACCP